MGVIAAAAAVEASRNRAIRRADGAWGAYARARAMSHQPSRGWVRREWPRVDGSRDGVTVAIEVASHITQLDYSTALVAIPPVPLKGNLELTREGLSSRVAKLLGAADLLLGDDAFDRAFVVKTSDEATARALLTPHARAEILALKIDRLVYDDGAEDDRAAMVVAEIVGIVDEVDTLDRALQLVVALARGSAP